MVNRLLSVCSNSSNDCRFMTSNTVSAARRAIEIEASGMAALINALDGPLGDALDKAVACILAASGRVIVTGMGKSGHIARKIAATFASTGTPASFVHPAEASHGDLGMITTNDVVVMLSNSGESAELKDMLNYCARFSVPMIAITANAASTMGRSADIVLQLPSVQEACPNGLAPTTSTLLQLALGDAMAMALLEAKGFSADDFRNYHPGGKLGAQIKHARDIMHHGTELPLAVEGMPLSVAIPILSDKKFGCLGVVDATGVLIGMVTDGDLRRHLGPDLTSRCVEDVMTQNPTTVHGDMVAAEVIEIINTKRITAVFVLDETRKPVGLIHIHDLLREGVS
jgi:arabinose-5-phosphate isomerase